MNGSYALAVPYWELVTRSFKIAWRYKYLWLLALFSGEAGFSFNYSQGNSRPISTRGQPPDFHAFLQPEIDWVTNHAALLIAGGVLYVILLIAFFILAAICEGAVVRAAAEHDAERPFGLRIAWRCGRATMGSIIRLRLLLVALVLPIAILLAALLFSLVWALIHKNIGAAAALGLIGLMLFFAALPYALYLSFLERLGTRAVVLEQFPAATAALRHAHRLLRKRLGRVLLVWLTAIATGFVVGIALLIPSAIVIVPLILVGLTSHSSGGPAFWLAVAVGVLIVLPVLLVIAAFLAAQGSTFWTLVYRRLEIDQVPAYAYPYPRPQPMAPPATPSA